MDYMSEGKDASISEEPYKKKTEDLPLEDDIAAAPQPLDLGYQEPQQIPAEEEADFGLLRRFFEKTEVPLTHIHGDRQYLLGLLRALLGQGPNESSA